MTRWVYRHEALENFSQLYKTLVDLLQQDIKSSREGYNRDTVTDAAALLNAIIQFQFLMAFVVMWTGLTILKGLSISLQSSSIDICKTYRDVSNTKASVQCVRDKIEDFQTQWFDLAKGMSEAVHGTSPEIPRRCGRQRHRNNIPAKNPKEYYKRSITIPFLIHLLTQLQERFSSDHQRVGLALSLVPSVMKNTPQWSENVKQLAELYQDDLASPQNLNIESLRWEVR